MIQASLVALLAGLCVLLLGEIGPRDRQETEAAVRRARQPVPMSRPRTVRGSAVSGVTGLGGAAIGGAIAGLPGLVIVGIAGAVAPVMVRRRRAAADRARLQEQMLDLVTSLASAMRTGRSLEQSLAIAGAELERPLGPTVTSMVDQVALGTRLEDALTEWSDDLGSADARLVVGVLRLHRRAGGSLSGPLDELITTLRARRAGARELRSLTAQARLSAAILGLLPIGFFLFLSVISRRDIEQAIATPAGAGAIGVGLSLQGAAFVWIRSLLRVEEA